MVYNTIQHTFDALYVNECRLRFLFQRKAGALVHLSRRRPARVVHYVSTLGAHLHRMDQRTLRSLASPKSVQVQREVHTQLQHDV